MWIYLKCIYLLCVLILHVESNCNDGYISKSDLNISPWLIGCFGTNIFNLLNITHDNMSSRSLSVGISSAASIDERGQLYIWGDWNTNTYPIPTTLPLLMMVSMGYQTTICGIDFDNYTHCFGNDEYLIVSNVPTSDKFETISVGKYAACGILLNGNVTCFGSYGIVTNQPTDKQFTHISVGITNACGISNYNIFCWGFGTNTASQNIRNNIPTGSFVSISVGMFVACAIKKDTMKPICWGDNFYNQVSDVPNSVNFLKIAAGSGVLSCGVTTSNDLNCWGVDTYSMISLQPQNTNYYNIEVGENAICFLESNACTSCWIGTYSSTDSCQDCDLGNYNMQFALNNCTTCDAGFYCPNSYQKLSCPRGYYCPSGQFQPQACTNGTYDFSSGGRTVDCASCPAGLYCLTTTTIHSCEKGFYCPLGSQQPMLCSSGTYSNEYNRSIDCESCPSGHFCQNTYTVSLCGAGNYCQVNSTSPTLCSLGTYSLQTNRSTDCPLCPAGSVCSNTVNKVPCPAGKFCAEGSATADILCPVGYYCPQGAISPSKCTNGTYCGLGGRSVDGDNCTAGFYCPSPTQRYSCAASFYCPEKSMKQIKCPDNHFCPEKSDQPKLCTSTCPQSTPYIISKCTSKQDLICSSIAVNNSSERSFSVPYNLIYISIVSLVCVLILNKIAVHFYPNTKPIRIFSFIFAVLDFISDVLFIVHMYLKIKWIFVVSLCLLIVFISVQSVYVTRLVGDLMNNEEFREFVLNHPLWFSIVFVVGSTSIESILVLSSNAFRLNILSAPIIHVAEQKIQRYGSIAMVFENLPQFIVQLIAAIELKEFNTAYVGFALFISSIQLIIAAVKMSWILVGHHKKQKSAISKLQLYETPSILNNNTTNRHSIVDQPNLVHNTSSTSSQIIYQTYVDDKSGIRYYHNYQTDETKWERPEGEGIIILPENVTNNKQHQAVDSLMQQIEDLKRQLAEKEQQTND